MNLGRSSAECELSVRTRHANEAPPSRSVGASRSSSPTNITPPAGGHALRGPLDTSSWAMAQALGPRCHLLGPEQRRAGGRAPARGDTLGRTHEWRAVCSSCPTCCLTLSAGRGETRRKAGQGRGDPAASLPPRNLWQQKPRRCPHPALCAGSAGVGGPSSLQALAPGTTQVPRPLEVRHGWSPQCVFWGEWVHASCQVLKGASA